MQMRIEKTQNDGIPLVNPGEQNNSPSFEVATETVGKSPRASTRSPKLSKSRHRASVACGTCRDRRIRCVVPPDGKECTQCKRAGVNCIIKNDDERRRPISRAYVCSLTDRILLLETMLKEQGVEVPPANHPPTNRQLLRNGERLARRRSSKTHQLQHLCHNLESERRSPDDYIKAEHGDLENLECQSGTRDTESFVLQPSEKECMGIGEGTPEKDTLLFSSKSMLIPVPTRGRSTDEISGQPLSKRRRTSHPQASTNISKCRSISSISIASASNAGLLDGTCKMPLLQQNDTQHVDDFTSTTPCSETSNWHALREPAPGVEYGFTTPSSTNRSTPGPCSAWMGADSEAVHSISQVASLNLSAFPTLEDTRDISDIDFLSFGDGGDNWGRVWTAETTFADELGAGYFPEKTRNVAWGFGR